MVIFTGLFLLVLGLSESKFVSTLFVPRRLQGVLIDKETVNGFHDYKKSVRTEQNGEKGRKAENYEKRRIVSIVIMRSRLSHWY